MVEAIKIRGHPEEELMQMDPVPLRALLRERTHHTIEIPIYGILQGKDRAPKDFGWQVRFLLDIWRKRGLPVEAPDLQWAQELLGYAEKLGAGEPVPVKTELPLAFSDQEMAAVKKLIFERRSVRSWVERKVPNDMIEEILEAGRAAPGACNLNPLRFIVIEDPEEAKLVWSDIPVENAVIIVLCQDMRSYEVVGHERFAPQNVYFDAAAAADHMLLMAHALGLGGVWLTHPENTSQKIREYYGLPDYYRVPLHIAVGWPEIGSIKSGRMKLEEMMIRKRT
jgi:nitroreductase